MYVCVCGSLVSQCQTLVGRTVHRSLGLGRKIDKAYWTSPKGKDMLKQLKLFGGVIFDEVSFAGVDLMNEFFQAMKALEGQGHNMHVIMVGDMYQLPPVQQTFVLTAVCQVERDLLRVLDQEEALKQQFVVSEFLELKRFSFTKQ